METNSLRFGGVSVDVPLGWREITDEVDAVDPPFTLADMSRDIGVLQFSFARHESGQAPNPSAADLLAMADELGALHGLDNPHDRVTESGTLRLGAVSLRGGDDFIRVWYISDGNSFVKVTYTCQWGMQSEQLPECEGIVRTIRFLKTTPRVP